MPPMRARLRRLRVCKLMKIVLASASPRRREILANIGYAPDAVIPSDADESLGQPMPPDEAVMLLSARKAESVLPKTDGEALIIASDTAVVFGDCFLGKPRDYEDGFAMLKMLSGQTHSVYTGVCILYKGKKELFCDKTDVRFYPLSDREIREYLDTGEPFDKAGAYGIQGRGSVLAEKIDGDFFSVMGLPAGKTARAIRRLTDKAE